MNSRAALLVALALASHSRAADAPGARYGIGQPISEQAASLAELAILPDGTGLPPGQGTPAQGKQLYAQRCAACHGDAGEGRADFAALVGGRGSLATENPVLTVGSYWPYATTLFDYIRRGMPYEAPGSLSSDDVYAITAWILHANGIIGEETPMNQRSLARVQMPNRDGFVADPRPDVPAGER